MHISWDWLEGTYQDSGQPDLSQAVAMVGMSHYAPAPALTSLTPTSGPVGTSVTLAGTGFAGASAVKFHGVSASYTVSSATRITVTVPAGATTGTVSVATPGGSVTSAASFTVTLAPAPVKASISKLSPTSGRRGATVTITGTHFGTKGHTSTVKFGTKVCTRYVSWTATRIKVKVPKKARFGRLKVTVKTADGTSNAESFRVRR